LFSAILHGGSHYNYVLYFDKPIFIIKCIDFTRIPDAKWIFIIVIKSALRGNYALLRACLFVIIENVHIEQIIFVDLGKICASFVDSHTFWFRRRLALLFLTISCIKMKKSIIRNKGFDLHSIILAKVVYRILAPLKHAHLLIILYVSIPIILIKMAMGPIVIKLIVI
jgi:hypothetical protein